MAEKLLPIYEAADIKGNEEKIAWMKLILEIKNEGDWADVEDRRNALREKIDRETERCVEQAETVWIFQHALPRHSITYS